MENITEIWKDVVGYAGKYMVSNYGRIKSMGFVLKCGSIKDNRIMALRLHRGYQTVILSLNGVQKAHSVHRIACIAFSGQSGKIVDHIDGNKSNNNISNLRFVTQRENVHFAARGSSKYPGVHWNKYSNTWQSRIDIDKKKTYLGSFKSEEEARNAFNTALQKLLSRQQPSPCYVQPLFDNSQPATA